MGRVYLALSALGLAFAWSARWPPHRPAFWRMPGFLMGWLSGELPLHHLALQIALTAGFGAVGAFASGPGRIGLVVSAVTAVLLIDLARRPAAAAGALERALAEALGADYRARIGTDLAAGSDAPLE